MDCDVLIRSDLVELFALADQKKALQCVQHQQEGGGTTKMDGQTQTFYARKNWSSVMLLNLWHPAMRTLTLQKLNTWTGRALHGFNWLDDQFVGEIPHEWNHLVGVDAPDPDAKIVHFTLGIPSMPGYQSCEHSAEWWKYRKALGQPAKALPS
jgi:lipopolysaccharide biosynthesis glycosyltransferase